MYWLSEELDLSPAQEKAVRVELRALREKLGHVREEGGRTRDELADIVRDEAFNIAGLEAMFGRHDQHLSSARTQIAAALERLHGLLDESQRHKLAELLGGSRRFWGPYR